MATELQVNNRSLLEAPHEVGYYNGQDVQRLEMFHVIQCTYHQKGKRTYGVYTVEELPVGYAVCL